MASQGAVMEESGSLCFRKAPFERGKAAAIRLALHARLSRLTPVSCPLPCPRGDAAPDFSFIPGTIASSTNAYGESLAELMERVRGLKCAESILMPP